MLEPASASVTPLSIADIVEPAGPVTSSLILPIVADAPDASGASLARSTLTVETMLRVTVSSPESESPPLSVI